MSACTENATLCKGIISEHCICWKAVMTEQQKCDILLTVANILLGFLLMKVRAARCTVKKFFLNWHAAL